VEKHAKRGPSLGIVVYADMASTSKKRSKCPFPKEASDFTYFLHDLADIPFPNGQ